MKSEILNHITRLFRNSCFYNVFLTSNNLNSTFYLPLVFLFFLFSINGNSQSLSTYQQIAAENNPALQAKYKQFEIAMQEVKRVGGLNAMQLSFGYFILPVETRTGPQRARLSLSQMFPWFGTLKAEKNVAALKAEAKYQAFVNARNQLFYEVAQAYFPLYELEQLKRIEGEQIELLKSYKNIAQSNFEQGEGSMADVLRVEILLKERKTNLKILEEQKKPLQATLNALLNREKKAQIEVDTTLALGAMPAIYEDSLLLNQPVITQLRLSAEASSAQVELEKKKGLPKIGLGLDYVIIDERNDLSAGMEAPAANGNDALMPMLSLQLPVYRKQYKAAQRKAALEQNAIELQQEAFRNNLIQQYESVLFDVFKERTQYQLFEEQAAVARHALNLLYTAYSNTGASFEEVLDMQQQLLAYEKKQVKALAQYQIKMAQLDFITAKNNLPDE